MAQNPDTTVFVNKALFANAKNAKNSYTNAYNSYTGADIKAVMYLPVLTRREGTQKIKVFADLQTISISRTRSVSPVRVLGRADPIDYTRGARTIAGTMVFASINKDAFNDVYDISLAESLMSSSGGFVADQLPPFSIVILASNEMGGVAVQALHGITLTNYGTTYSINDMYTEATYTYVATNLTPLTTDPNAVRTAVLDSYVESAKSISTALVDSMKKAYARMDSISSRLKAKEASKTKSDEPRFQHP